VPLLFYAAKRSSCRIFGLFLYFFTFLYMGWPPDTNAGGKQTKAIERLFEWPAIAMFEEGYPTLELNS
jgi:hypothetical protein